MHVINFFTHIRTKASYEGQSLQNKTKMFDNYWSD